MGRGAGQPSSSSWAWSSPSAWSPSSLPSSSSWGLRFAHHQNPLLQLLLPCGCARPSLARCARRSKLLALRARGERSARGHIGKRGTVRRGQWAQNRRRQHRRHGARGFRVVKSADFIIRAFPAYVCVCVCATGRPRRLRTVCRADRWGAFRLPRRANPRRVAQGRLDNRPTRGNSRPLVSPSDAHTVG